MTAVIIQPAFVPIANWNGPNGKPVPVYVTQEWRRPLEQLAQLVNTQAETIAALTARIEALETP